MTDKSRRSTCATACNGAESAPIGAVSDSTTQAAKNIVIRRRSFMEKIGRPIITRLPSPHKILAAGARPQCATRLKGNRMAALYIKPDKKPKAKRNTTVRE
jgi:hypothetical protein